jgi:hypothetical protein
MLNFFKRINPLIEMANASHARKAKADKWLNYYADQQSAETFRLIARRFGSPETFRIFQLNVVRKIVNKRANLYRLAPRRVFEGLDQTAGDDFYRASNADVVLKRASRLTKLLKSCALQVGYKDGAPTLNIITPNILDVIADDPSNPTEYLITHKASKAQHVTYSHWTPSTYQRLDYRGQPLPISSNPDGVNPYGILPFIPLHDTLPDDQFFIPGGDDLIEGQEAINVALTNLWQSVELQAHGQPWVTGAAGSKPLELGITGGPAFGPDRMIYLPENGRMGYAAPNSPIKDILEAIQFSARMLTATNDLSADVLDLDRRSESGAAKHVEQIDLREARQDDIALWRTYEARLFNVLRTVINTHQPGAIPDSAKVSVDFAEMQESLSETERLINARTKFDLGVWSPVDVLRSENPDGYPTREDAVRELLRRKDETAQIVIPD